VFYTYTKVEINSWQFNRRIMRRLNLFVKASNGVRYAYRHFGKTGRTPLLFLRHFRGGLDNWDPLLTDTISAEREVILLDNTGVGLSGGTLPKTVLEMAASSLVSAVRRFSEPSTSYRQPIRGRLELREFGGRAVEALAFANSLKVPNSA
jgi:pimeloyl-ACP methyl ester carboxylesterase